MKEKKVPLRMCVSCREMKPKKELVRVVKSADGKIFVDETFKAQGRGAYVCTSKACFDKCVKSKALNRQFGCAVSDDILAEISNKVNNAE